MKLFFAAKKVENGVDEIITYMEFPTDHWPHIRTNNATERVNSEIKLSAAQKQSELSQMAKAL